ncbi:carbohydrate ABC transporter permease [Clostridium sp. chh4-2]|uniref:carbohydrate ABC transporter permease n=1 Tax=Clostridium sp. chh4-2 TaxID=2067550 RepID=UPI001FA8FA5C|nr:carbohydrate ABC transporter permease [Clostridium sp. chh4-2]
MQKQMIEKRGMKESGWRTAYRIFNGIFLALICTIVVLPIWNIIITSLAEDKDVMGGIYLMIPKSVTFKNYARVLQSGYMKGFYNSLLVAAGGTALAMVVTVPLGYALAQKKLVFRKFFMRAVSITLVFEAGIMPFYVLIRNLKLIDSYLSLILPFAVSTFNLIIVKNYMSSIPESLMESARLDGCNDIEALVRIVLPISVPILAAVTLFYFVSFWNRYTEAVMFINSSDKYTLQVMLRALVFQGDGSLGENNVVYDNTKMAVMVLGMLPVLVIYPFVQRYFVTGLMLGSVKE